MAGKRSWTLRIGLYSLLLLVLNTAIAWRLFFVDYSDRMGSMEASFISLAQQIRENWRVMFGWWPLWYGGMPFQNTYPPLLHAAVAALAAGANISTALAYHIVIASAYVLGPVTVFWLALRLTFSPNASLAGALLYSLWSPSAALFSEIRADLGGAWLAQRLHSLVTWGDGPNIAALTLLPLAILALDLALERKTIRSFILAGFAIALVPLVNWPASIALAFAVIAYGLVYAKRWRQGARIAGICVYGYALDAFWIPPSNIHTIETNTQLMNPGYVFREQHVLYLACYIAAAVLLEKLLSRLEVHRSLRFSLIFLLPLAALVCGNYWFRTELLAQPWRFHIAMEMALMLCVAAILPHFSLPRIPVRVLQAAFILFCCVQAVHYRSYARRLIRRIDVSKTSEYKMSRWIAQNLPGERVMVPGSVSFWLNVFADTPQLTGCCSQGLIDREVRYGQYQIENDIGAKGREFPITLVWLQALGVRAIGVSGPRSTEWYKAIQHPGKFVGKLPELWRDGDDVVYRVPQRSASLVHVLRRDQAVSRAPVNGIDIDPLLPYVAALEDPAYPQAEITWKSDNLAQIQAPLDSGELLSIQIAADPGWRAVSNGKPLRIEKDGLGFMMVDPQCTGLCTVDLIYNGGLEASITGFVSSLALVFGLVVLVFKVRISLIKSAE